MKLINLDARLKAAADYVRTGVKVADVGTDHAFLPVYLIQVGKATKAIGCDINNGPLENARQTISKYGLTEKIQLRLSDGLSDIKSFECDDIIIAGMGGELIASIISNAPWVKSNNYRLILQPMTKPEYLRGFLCKNGFCIDDETAVVSNHRYYTVMSVFYSGKSNSCDELFKHFGKLINKKDQCSINYLLKVKQKLLNVAQQLILQDESSVRAKDILKLIDRFERSI